MDLQLLTILCKSNAFNKTSYPNARLLTLSHNFDETNRLDHARYISYSSRIASSQMGLKLQAINYIDDFVKGFLLGPPIQSIQHLHFDRASISLDSLCSLISLLPRMAQLSFAFLTFDEKYSEIGKSGMYNHICSKWRTLSEQLQVCHISGYNRNNADSLATCGMLLALLCPRFTRLVVHELWHEEFNESIQQALKREPYVRHAEQLKRLTFNDAIGSC